MKKRVMDTNIFDDMDTLSEFVNSEDIEQKDIVAITTIQSAREYHYLFYYKEDEDD